MVKIGTVSHRIMALDLVNTGQGSVLSLGYHK